MDVTDNEITTGDWVCYKCMHRAETAAKLTIGTLSAPNSGRKRLKIL